MAQLAGQADTSPRQKQGRTHERLPIRQEILIIITSYAYVGFPEATRFVARSHDVSPDGIGLLYGGYMHSGTRCLVTMINQRRYGLSVKGTIVRCRHVRGNIHEIGIKFDQQVDLAKTVSSSAAGQPKSG